MLVLILYRLSDRQEAQWNLSKVRDHTLEGHLRMHEDRSLTDTDLCPCGETQTMFHIVESCPLTKINGGLSQLHSADEEWRHCFVADQFWFMTRIREADYHQIVFCVSIFTWVKMRVSDAIPVWFLFHQNIVDLESITVSQSFPCVNSSFVVFEQGICIHKLLLIPKFNKCSPLWFCWPRPYLPMYFSFPFSPITALYSEHSPITTY